MLEKIQSLNVDKNIRYLLASFEDFMSRRTTFQEFQADCFRWTYHYALQDLRYKGILSIPYSVRAFYDLSDSKKKKIMEEDGNVRTRVMEFRKEQDTVKNQNRSNMEWLKQMLKFFEGKNEMDKVAKIKEVMRGETKVDKVRDGRAAGAR